MTAFYLQELNHFLHHSCSQGLCDDFQGGRKGAAENASSSLGKQTVKGNSKLLSDMLNTLTSEQGGSKTTINTGSQICTLILKICHGQVASTVVLNAAAR